jgi:hypothetical protein
MQSRAQGCRRSGTLGMGVRAMGMGVDLKRRRRHQESDMDTIHQLHEAAETSPAHENELLDEGLEESFPASDPAAVQITRIVEETKDS